MCRKQIYTYANRQDPNQLLSNSAAGLRSNLFATMSIIFHKKNKQTLKVLKSRRQYDLFLENYPAFKRLKTLNVHLPEQPPILQICVWSIFSGITGNNSYCKYLTMKGTHLKRGNYCQYFQAFSFTNFKNCRLNLSQNHFYDQIVAFLYKQLFQIWVSIIIYAGECYRYFVFTLLGFSWHQQYFSYFVMLG